VYSFSKAASGQQSRTGGDMLTEKDCTEASKESPCVVGGVTSWQHHSTPQMNPAPPRRYTDRRLQQLRAGDDNKDAMHRFK